MRFLRIRRDEQGSMAITMSVVFIATSLSAAVLTTVWRDIRVSRRSGDAANALQVADAGLNDAVKALSTAGGVVGTCPGYPALPGFERTDTIAGGTYKYCAAKDQDAQGRPVWHIDATGVDATGVKRRLRSDAVSTPSFPNAINVLATGSFSSGFSVDSYKDEVNRCTGKGNIGTNSPETFSFGNNGLNSSENCRNNPNGNWPHPPDGCIAYSRDGTKDFKPTSVGNGQCPPSNTKKDSPELPFRAVSSVSRYDIGGSGNFECTSPTLQAGKHYLYTSVTLGVGCGFPSAGPFPTMGEPTVIYTTTLTIAGGQGNNNSGNNNLINPPPNSTTVCGSTHGQAGSDPQYCPGWAGGLKIVVMGGDVTFSGNHSKFWGVIEAPSSAVSWSGGGGSQYEIWGSMIAQSVSGAVQAKWHYDENLGQLTSGAFFARNWREEPQT